MFIVLEGIDGSGKTSLSQILAEKIDGVAYATPPEKYRELRKKIDTQSSIQKHYEFYRDAVIEASTEIASLLVKGKSVICDRYWLTTLVYHRAGMMTLDGSDFSHLTKPDLTVLLLVSAEEQLRRSVNKVGGGKNIAGKQLELTNLYWEALVASRDPFITINTDEFDLDACSNIILATIQKKSH